MRLICCLIALSFIVPKTMAQNPFLWMQSGKPVESEWSGTEWFDQVSQSSNQELPITATVTTRRVAKMNWGQIVRFRFLLPGESEIPPLYFLVRDDAILDLTSDDMDYLIGTVATMKSAPQYEPTDVRALLKVGKHSSADKPWSSTVTTTDDTSTYEATHPSGHFSKLIWKRGLGLVEYSIGHGARKDGCRLQRTGFGRRSVSSVFDYTKESIGSLKIGLGESAVLTAFSDKPEKGENEHWGADGEWHQDWGWPKDGVRLDMSSLEEVGSKQVSSIQIKAPGTLKTHRGIGIGDSEAKVSKAYKNQLSKEDSEPGVRVVVGSMFGGLIFTIEEGKVTSIFAGAASE